MVQSHLERVAGVRMSGRGPLSMDDSRDSCNCSRCGG